MILLSIDPGINFCGLTVSDYTDKHNVIETVLVKNIRKLTEEEKVVEKIRGIRVVKILAILTAVSNLISKYKIETIVVESPFYNSLTPMAYGSILEVIFAIKYSIVLSMNLTLEVMEPLLIKKMFTNKAMASKDLMKEFLNSKVTTGEIVLSDTIVKDDLSEHEIDAIAIAYVFFKAKEAQTEIPNA
jgi:Holliday junction resolvasome RuvABC endonuclease subunit